MKLKKVSIIFYLMLLLAPPYLISNNEITLAEEVNNKDKIDLELEENAYLLGPGDIVNLTFLNNETLSGKYKVMSNGSLLLPLIGEIDVNNISINSASKTIRKLYSKELIDPSLFLTIAEPRPIKISIIGEVVRPGLYQFPDANTEISKELPTIIDVIQEAGGITPKTNLKDVTLIRKLSGKDGQFKVASLDLVELIIEGNQSQNPFLFDGDIIKLEKANEISSIELQASNSNINPAFIEVSVIGKVYNPGKLKVKSNTPLIQAILEAGGPIDWKASKGNIQHIRINENGSVSLKSFRLDISRGASQKYNPILKNGDIVKVNTSAYASFSEGLSTATEPFAPIINSITLLKLLQ